MGVSLKWRRETEPRLQGSRDLDSSKLQAPGVFRKPDGGYRLFYTAVGPAKPFTTCQGYILSAVSDDGLVYEKEPGVRLAPQPAVPHMSLRVIAPSIAATGDGRWRMYFESRGSADVPTVICSAISADMLHWDYEPGIRLQGFGGVGGPRYLPMPDGRGRLYCFASEFDSDGLRGGKRISQSVMSAITTDGLNFQFEPGYRLRDKQFDYDFAGITAAEVIPPQSTGDNWTMFYSAWQNAPEGAAPPKHPSMDAEAVANGRSADFATASILADMSGYRSRIYVAYSPDGLTWTRAGCVIDGPGYNQPGLDAVHAEDMSLIDIGNGQFRMYYAACDQTGKWRVVSAVSE